MCIHVFLNSVVSSEMTPCSFLQQQQQQNCTFVVHDVMRNPMPRHKLPSTCFRQRRNYCY